LSKKIQRLPLPQRYINKRDLATQKTIEIIGKDKYKELLDNNIIIVDYEIMKYNQKANKERIERLKKTILFLSSLLNLQAHPHQTDCPTDGILFRTYRHHQQQK